MNFIEAHVKLQEIADGRYNALYYELTTHASGEKEQICRLYLDPRISVTGSTWEKAFDGMDAILHPENIPPVIVDNFPELEEIEAK